MMCVVHNGTCKCFSVSCDGEKLWTVRYKEDKHVITMCDSELAECIVKVLNSDHSYSYVVWAVNYILSSLANIYEKDVMQRLKEE
jgi:hypothetical protein